MKKVNIEDLLNLWLEPYHNTNMDKVLKTHSKWEENPQDYTTEFYSTYRVTQEQHDEWQDKAKKYVKKITKCSKRVLDHNWPWVYLDCAPQVIKNNE